MWYLVLPLVGYLVVYLYRTLARTTSGEVTDHSIDAYIVEGMIYDYPIKILYTETGQAQQTV